jgi:ADP-ribosyl-[dinitrogen reductase] hydrolase
MSELKAVDPVSVGVSNRWRGSLLGLAVGDAVGACVEASAPHSFPPVTVDCFSKSKWRTYPNPHRLSPGQWTDDTSMALCLAASLLRKRALDGVDVITEFRSWWKDAKWTASKKKGCFDIGGQCKAAITRRGWRSDPFLGPAPARAGVGSNGCIMRLAPVPLWAYAAGTGPERHEEAAVMAAQSCLTTHRWVEWGMRNFSMWRL